MDSDRASQKPLPYSNKGDLTRGSVRKHLARLTIPSIWGMLAVIAVQLADTYFIGLMNDTHILAGISLTFPVTMAISHLVFGVNIAMSSVVSRLIGANKHDEAKTVVLHGLMIAFCTSAVIALLCFIFMQPLFNLLGADENSWPTVAAYMPIWLIASVLLAVPVNGNSAIRAGGDTVLPAILMTTTAVVNFVLDPLLIFGLAGFPELGVQGAAVATLISYIFCFALGMYFLIVKKNLVATDGLHLDQFKSSLKRMIVIAIPAGIANIIQPATNAVIIAVLAAHGNAAVAAMGIVSRIEALAMLVIIALALGMAPLVGQNWGANKLGRVHETINNAIGFNFIWSFFVAILLGVFARSIAGEFTDDPAVIEYAALFFWIVPFSYAFGNLVFGWSSIFNAMGMPQRAFFLILMKCIVITIPAIFIGSALYGVTGIFIAIAIANTAAGIFFHVSSWRACKKEEARRIAQNGEPQAA